MAVRGQSAAARTTRWDVMVTNVKSSIPDMPYIADDVATLEALTIKARLLETRQEDLRSQAISAHADLQATLIQGDDVRARLGAAIKGKLGFSDAALRKFGIKPFNKGQKKKGGPTPTPTPTPPPTGTESTAGPAHAGTVPAEPAPPAPTPK